MKESLENKISLLLKLYTSLNNYGQISNECMADISRNIDKSLVALVGDKEEKPSVALNPNAEKLNFIFTLSSAGYHKAALEVFLQHKGSTALSLELKSDKVAILFRYCDVHLFRALMERIDEDSYVSLNSEKVSNADIAEIASEIAVNPNKETVVAFVREYLQVHNNVDIMHSFIIRMSSRGDVDILRDLYIEKVIPRSVFESAFLQSEASSLAVVLLSIGAVSDYCLKSISNHNLINSFIETTSKVRRGSGPLYFYEERQEALEILYDEIKSRELVSQIEFTKLVNWPTSVGIEPDRMISYYYYWLKKIDADMPVKNTEQLIITINFLSNQEGSSRQYEGFDFLLERGIQLKGFKTINGMEYQASKEIPWFEENLKKWLSLNFGCSPLDAITEPRVTPDVLDVFGDVLVPAVLRDNAFTPLELMNASIPDARKFILPYIAS